MDALEMVAICAIRELPVDIVKILIYDLSILQVDAARTNMGVPVEFRDIMRHRCLPPIDRARLGVLGVDVFGPNVPWSRTYDMVILANAAIRKARARSKEHTGAKKIIVQTGRRHGTVSVEWIV